MDFEQAVEFAHHARVDALAAPRHQSGEVGRRGLDQEDARRFERFEKAAREPHCDDIARPARRAASGLEAQQPRLVERRAVERVEQGPARFFFAAEGAGKDMAVADPVLKRDAPGPAAALRRRARIGGERRDARARHRQRAVAGEPRAPVEPRHAHRLAKKERAEARAVYEEIARDLVARSQRQARDIAALGIAHDIDDLALHAADAARRRPFAQIGGIEPGVEMIGIAVGRADRFRVVVRMFEAVGARRGDREAVIL